MMKDKKVKIAVIVEEQSLQDYIVLLLVGEDYEVKGYSSQDEAISALGGDIPELIIIDFQTPRINGMDVCKALRKNYFFNNVPLIFLMPEADTAQLNKGKAIYAGCDDYIQNSKLEEELLLRVRLNLHRILRQQDVNPITRLPGQASLLKELQKRIENKTATAVCYLDLFNFRDFNRRYGFKRGDAVLGWTASLIAKHLSDFGGPTDFLAHPRSDDFVFAAQPESAETIVQNIIREFDESAPSFYDSEDRSRGHLLLKNRKGEIEKIPLLRVHIGVVTNENYQFVNTSQILEVAGELKDFAQKSFDKSMYAKERRKEYSHD